MNKVVQHLRDQAFLEQLPNRGFRVRDFEGLLQAWRAAYRFDRHSRRPYFTLLQGRALQDRLRALDPDGEGRLAYAAFSAADLQAPAVRQPRTWLYLDPNIEQEFQSAVEAKSVDSGENLVVLIPDDGGVFYRVEAGSNRAAMHERRADVRGPRAFRRSRRGGRGSDPPATSQAGVVRRCEMNPEPRHEGDYTDRQVVAARRVLVDVAQVLAAFRDAMVVVGGWVPDLLFPAADPKHVGSIDVDLALDAAKLGDGRYAELLKLLLDTGRYGKG